MPAGPAGPAVVRHVMVYAEPGRFGGWPANHGIWSWGDEILVGFSRGYVQGPRPRPARTSTTTGPRSTCWPAAATAAQTWAVEDPAAAGALRPGRQGAARRPCRRAVAEKPWRDCPGGDRLHPPRLRPDRPHGDTDDRAVPLLLLDDRGHDLGRAASACRSSARRGSAARTDYLVNGKQRLPAVPDRVEGGRPRGPAVLRPDDRRRA